MLCKSEVKAAVQEIINDTVPKPRLHTAKLINNIFIFGISCLSMSINRAVNYVRSHLSTIILLLFCLHMRFIFDNRLTGET